MAGSAGRSKFSEDLPHLRLHHTCVVRRQPLPFSGRPTRTPRAESPRGITYLLIGGKNHKDKY